jgi:hypothetical protein
LGIGDLQSGQTTCGQTSARAEQFDDLASREHVTDGFVVIIGFWVDWMLEHDFPPDDLWANYSG